MKVRIKKTGQILNVEYDDDDLYKGWDGSGPVWFTYNEFDFVDEEADDSQPLFTLTAEEVDLLNDVLIHMIKDKALIFYDESKVLIDNLLIRMKQYQDET